MKRITDFFPVGASYAPLAKATEVDISEWPDDLRNFRNFGYNTFRLFICHDRVEQRHGQRDFSRIDRAFELAAENDLKVIVNIGGTFTNLQSVYPPRWLYYDLGCTLCKSSPEASEKLEGNRLKLCYDDPVYQRETKDFIQAAVTRYKDHPSLIAWSGWNEPNPTECFCPHTLNLFRAHLKEKYGTLDELAKAWSTEFPVYFRTWDDVFPQPQAGFSYGGYIPYQDWVLFLAENLRDKFRMICSWVKEIDQETPVISHFSRTWNSDFFGCEDIPGTSVYSFHAQQQGPDWEPYEFTHRQNLFFLPEGRRKNRRDPNGFWVVETEGGPVAWVHYLLPRSYSPRKYNARDVLFAAHGARAILRWLYRSRVSDGQAGEFNLVGWDGSATERAELFGKLARFFNRHATLFLTHEPDNPGIYIWDGQGGDGMAIAESYQKRYVPSIHHLWAAFRESGFAAEICDTRQILEGILDQAKVFAVPFNPYVNSEEAEILRKFVAGGGLLLAESPFAIKNRQGIHYEFTPGLLTDVFGLQVYDLEKLESGECGGIHAIDFHAKIRLKGAVADACFPNGDPAIASHRYGKGMTVLYASVLGSAYEPDTGEALRRELTGRLAAFGLGPAWKIEDLDIAAAKNIQVHPRRLPDGGKLLFVLNMDEVPHEFTVTLPCVKQAEELGNSDSPGCCSFDGKFHFRLAEWGWSVWHCIY
ncbi:MAG: beta-galactosidase [Lentisphaeria bacterium]|nr:beta-galactosidase [Lentisphaeria bacterium]